MGAFDPIAEIRNIADENGLAPTRVLANVALAKMSLVEPSAVRAAFEAAAARLKRREQMAVRFRLWELDGDSADLAAAHRLLASMRDHAPEDCRESVVENVPLHRDIVAAWEAHGGGE